MLRARSRASSSIRSCVLFRMKPAGTRRIRCAASFVQSKVEINGFFLSSRAMSLASLAAPVALFGGFGRARSRHAGGGGWISSGAPVSSSITCRANSSVIASSFIMRARFSTRAFTRRRW